MTHDPVTEKSPAAAVAADAFGLDLYRRLAVDGQDLVFSPASIAAALQLALLGARGSTAEQLADRTAPRPDRPGRGCGGRPAAAVRSDPDGWRERRRHAPCSQYVVGPGRTAAGAQLHPSGAGRGGGRGRGSRLQRRPATGPGRDQRTDRRADGGQDHQPAGPGRGHRRHPAGPGQRGLPQGALGVPVHRDGDPGRPVPPGRRGRADHCRDDAPHRQPALRPRRRVPGGAAAV